jgi:hypothetical protein
VDILPRPLCRKASDWLVKKLPSAGWVVHTGCGSNLHEGVDNRAQPSNGGRFSGMAKK